MIQALIIGTVAVAIAAAVVGSVIPQVPLAVSIILLILLVVLLVVLLVWIELRLTYVVYVIDDDVRTGQKRSVWAEIGAGGG